MIFRFVEQNIYKYLRQRFLFHQDFLIVKVKAEVKEEIPEAVTSQPKKEPAGVAFIFICK